MAQHGGRASLRWLSAVGIALALGAGPASALAGKGLRRQEFALGVALGTAGLRGVGIGQVGGAGGSLSLRVGTVATPRLLWILQLNTAGQPISVQGPAGESKLRVHQQATLTLGPQYYHRDALWFKGGLGFAGLTLAETEDSPGERLKNGLGLLGSVGYDVLQRQIFALSIEITTSTGLYAGGSVTALALSVSANWY